MAVEGGSTPTTDKGEKSLTEQSPLHFHAARVLYTIVLLLSSVAYLQAWEGKKKPSRYFGAHGVDPKSPPCAFFVGAFEKTGRKRD